MKITLDGHLCLGCQRCRKTCPEVFKQAGKKVALIKNESDLETAKMAYEDCPAGAIRISE